MLKLCCADSMLLKRLEGAVHHVFDPHWPLATVTVRTDDSAAVVQRGIDDGHVQPAVGPLGLAHRQPCL